jgi:site-specific recombinase XerD
MRGKAVKFEGHPLNRPIPGYTFSPQAIHKHVMTLRAFSNWVKQEGYTKNSIFELLELLKLPKNQIPILSPEMIQQVLESINANTFMGARLYAMVFFTMSGVSLLQIRRGVCYRAPPRLSSHA